MKPVKKLIFIFLFAAIGNLLFLSCSEKEKSVSPALLLEAALQQAGENRAELEKVLSRYKTNPADSLKYKAACFLIENMPYYSYYEGTLLDKYLSYYSMLKETREAGIDPKVVADSIPKMYGALHMDSLHWKRDIQTIDSAYLCRNIEWAFKVWEEQPWGKNVTFDTFCEYILPYRIEDEKLADWREIIYNKYNPILDSLRASAVLDKENPIVAVYCLSEVISREDETFFTTSVPTGLPHAGPEIVQLKHGSCREFADFVVYVSRALGIPCAIDFIPIRGNENDGHFWVSFADKYGEIYLQDFPQRVMNLREDKICSMPKIKVYRRTFSLNRKMQEAMNALDTVVPELFDQPHFVDVTAPYAKNYNKSLLIPSSALYPGKPASAIAYLCASKRNEWTPVAWTEFDRDNLSFPDVQKGSVLRVATYEKGRLAFWTDPFEVDISNEFHFFTTRGDSLQDVVLFAKYTLESEERFSSRMIGGIFEGSNDADFRWKDTLYIIDKMPGRLKTTIQTHSNKVYRYVRYLGAPESHCNIAEATFYTGNDTTALKGKVIGTPGCYQKDGSHEYTNVFDGKSWTSFDYKDPSGGWAGLDFGKPKCVSKIVYTPRNRDNYIRPGDDYELFCCTGRWRSLGSLTSGADSLCYKNVPKGVLLYLKNYSRGTQERVFTYEDGRQIWK